MGPESKDAVVRTLGHIIDELLQQRVLLQRIEGKIEKGRADTTDDLGRVNGRMLELERAHLKLKDKLDGAHPTPAE